jgi:hypothetical protein
MVIEHRLKRVTFLAVPNTFMFMSTKNSRLLWLFTWLTLVVVATGDAIEVELRLLRQLPFNTNDYTRRNFLLPHETSGILAIPDKLYRYQGPLTSDTDLEDITPDGYLNPTLVFRASDILFVASEDRTNMISTDGGDSFGDVNPAFGFSPVINWMQQTNGIIYCNAGSGLNLFASVDDGITWDLVNGERVNHEHGTLYGSYVYNGRVIFSYLTPISVAYQYEGLLDSSGLHMTTPPQTSGGVTDFTVGCFARNRFTGTIFAGYLGKHGISRSTDSGHVFYNPGAGPQNPYPQNGYSVKSICFSSRYANRVLAGGMYAGSYPLLAVSDNDGLTWQNHFQLAAEHGTNIAFLTEDVDGRILAGISRTGTYRTLSIVEVMLPDMVSDAESNVTSIRRKSMAGEPHDC